MDNQYHHLTENLESKCLLGPLPKEFLLFFNVRNMEFLFFILFSVLLDPVHALYFHYHLLDLSAVFEVCPEEFQIVPDQQGEYCKSSTNSDDDSNE
jgi:hypothetical protein